MTLKWGLQEGLRKEKMFERNPAQEGVVLQVDSPMSDLPQALTAPTSYSARVEFYLVFTPKTGVRGRGQESC